MDTCSLTDDALEIVFSCWYAEQLGNTFAPDPEWLGACEEAREKGWLVRELSHDRIAYNVSPNGYMALDLNAAIGSTRGREN